MKEEEEDGEIEDLDDLLRRERAREKKRKEIAAQEPVVGRAGGRWSCWWVGLVVGGDDSGWSWWWVEPVVGGANKWLEGCVSLQGC